MNTTRILSVLALSLLTATTLCAQPPGRGGGDRGDRGGGGGPPGRGFGDRGGGDRGGFGGGDRGGSSGGRPSFGGRPSGGGPPGGGFGSRGGGTPGGGGDRGSRGGFDASSMLSRLDANGNGVLDPSEQQGPASFLISRMQQSDPSIKAGQPIPLSKITEGFQKMREQRDGGGNDGGRDSGRSAADDAMMPELLVPGFGVEDELSTPLLGFGAAAEMLSVPVTDDDKREAEERMRRYDRNRDGYLSKDEVSRFSGNPMDFDRNRDGKLSSSELSVRYARRREGEEEARKKPDQRRERQSDETAEVPDVFNGRKSYRPTSARKLPDGLPGFFTDKDANSDGQLTMAEFSGEWNDDVISSFFASDFNRDGVITADEALRGVEEGGAPVMASTSAASTSSSTPSSSTPSSTTPSSASPAPASGKPDEKYVKVVQRIVERYDKNKDSVLTASEWGEMLMNPSAADGNRDGRITIDEYALWMQSRQKK